MTVKVSVLWIVCCWAACVGSLEGNVNGGAGMEEVRHSQAPWNLWSVYSTASFGEVTFPRTTTSSPLTFGHLRSFPTSTEIREEETEEEEENSYEENEVSSWLDPQPTPSSPHKGGEERGKEGVEFKGLEDKEGNVNKRKRDEEHPAIASIRHHKSRKSFVRARKSKGKASPVATTSSLLSLLLSGEQGDEPMRETLRRDRPESSQKHSQPSTASTLSSDKAPLRLLRQQSPTSSSAELGKMSSSNDTSVVYGRPYFTPSRKHNSTRMQRIKDLLSNASTSQFQMLGKDRTAAGPMDAEKENAVTVSVHSKSSRHPTKSPGPTNPETFLLDPHTLLPPISASATLSPPASRPPRVKSSRRKSKIRSSTPPPTSINYHTSTDDLTPVQNSLEGSSGYPKAKSTASAFIPTMPAPHNLLERPHAEEHFPSHHLNLPAYHEKASYSEGPNPKMSTQFQSGLNFLGGLVYQEGTKGSKEPEADLKPNIKESGQVEELFPYTGADDDGVNQSRPPSELFSDYSSVLLGGEDKTYVHSAFESSLDAAVEDLDEETALLPSSTSSSASGKTKPDIDIVTKFLRIVETQHTLGDNCTAGTAFSLGEGVVDRYAQERFRLEANVAVNRANMLTRLWKYAEPPVLESEYLLHANLFSMIEFDDDIFAAGNCYDKSQYKNYTLFCPYAFRLPEGNILVKDLAVEYKYLSNTSEWFFIARNNAERVIKNYNQFSRGFNSYAYNESTHTERVDDEILNVTYEDGKWSKPYFDCGGGNIWMMTYTVPFFGYHDGRYFFKGTSGIDIDLRRVDIDQCPLPDNSTELNIFAASDKCKNATTKCVPIKGLGFRRGSYRCECQPGYYFPNTSSTIKYFNGTVLEEEYEKKLMNEKTMYEEGGAFECIRCLEGCDTCEDDRPCVVTLNWLMRSAILILQCAIIAMLPIVGLFTWKYSDIKVVRAASPVLLRFIVLGAFLIYCTILVMYPSPSLITCTLRVWLREIGFSLAYGALMLKTWRISVIFRVRSAKAVKITDLDLMKRLGIIVAMFAALLVIRTLVAPPHAIVSLTADDLKAWLCQTDWWDHSFTFMELIFLVWGIRLCIVVRKAPSEFNESKFISLAIYNEFLLSVFLNISMLFLQSPANPDLLYIIFFCHVQLTMTLLLCLIFGSKAYMVFRGHGKGSSSDETRVPTFISKNRSGQKPKQPSGQNSTTGVHSSTTSTSQAHDPNFNSRLSEDVQPVCLCEPSPIFKEEEFRRLYYQLEELKERNMRLGNRHLVAKITAMQEAADSILSAPTANCHVHQTTMQQQLLGHGRDSKSHDESGAESEGAGQSSNVLSDITEEDNSVSGSGKPVVVKKKRQSFFNRVKSTKRLMSIRSKSAKECNRGKSVPSKSAQVVSETSDVSKGATNDDDVPTDDRTMMPHGGVYIGEVIPTSAERGSTSSPDSSDSTKATQGPSGSPKVPLGHSDSHKLSSRGSSKVSQSKSQSPSVTRDANKFQYSRGAGDMSESAVLSQVLAEVQLHRRADTSKKCNSPKICTKVQEGAQVLCDDCDSIEGMETLCSNEMPESIPMTVLRPSESHDPSKSPDKNHSTSDPSKILLDLNDKSRFTEEITV